MAERFTLFYESKSPFSNFCPAEFKAEGHQFHWSEQYFMWLKARHFGDEAAAAKILNAASPAACKKLGRTVRGFDEKKWEAARVDAMRTACRAKFAQNLALRRALMATVGSTLVEASPTDRVWGIGLRAGDADARVRARWRGLNLLGGVLTALREEFAMEQQDRPRSDEKKA